MPAKKKATKKAAKVTKKSYNVKGTQKQKRAIQKMAENGGNASAAMREAGYSEETIKDPGKLTNSKAYREFFKEHISHDVLKEKHLALLNKQQVIAKNNNETGEIEIIRTGEIDVQAVKAGLDMAYKVVGEYAAEKHEHGFANISDEELRESVARRIASIVSGIGGAGDQGERKQSKKVRTKRKVRRVYK